MAAGAIYANLQGFKAFRKRFGDHYKDSDQYFRRHLRESVKMVFDLSQHYVPVEFGPLKASGKIITNRADSRITSYTISYGDGLPRRYAFWVEVREYSKSGKFVRHDPPTKAWYVTSSYKELEPKIKAKMARAVKQLNARFGKGKSKGK